MSGETVQLSKPIQAHGGEVSEITLREPDGEDVIAIGYPYLILMKDGQEHAIEIRARVIYNYISRLGGIPLSSAKKIALRDLSKLQAVIMGFFGEGEGKSEAESSS